jgi:hypothetical protein
MNALAELGARIVPVIPDGQLITRVAVAGRELELSGVTAAATIRFGRVDPSDGPTASTLSLELIDLVDAHGIACGDLLEVDTAGGVPRFRGWITDLEQSWDPAGRVAITAAGNLARVSLRQIGTADYPQEAWSARVARVFADAEWTAYTVQAAPAGNDPLVAARLAAQTTLGNELANLAATQAAAVVDLPDGSILVQAIYARQYLSAPVLELPPDHVLWAPDWVQTLDVVNVVDVTYGTLEDSHTVTSRNTESVARYGERSTVVGSTFASSGPAALFGGEMVVRRGYPRWLLPDVQVLGMVTPVIGGLVLLTELPAGSPVVGSWQPVCEGWTDVLEGDAWTTTVQLSDSIRSGMSIPWRAVPAGVQWLEVDPDCKWTDAVDLNHLLGVS